MVCQKINLFYVEDGDVILLITERQRLHEQLIENKTKINIVKGRNKGKTGIVARKSELKNYDYGTCGNYHYYDYFDLTVLIDDKKVCTSCNHIEVA